MNFWKAQKRARSKTTLYVFIFLVLTFGAAIFAEYLMRALGGDSYDTSLPYIGFAFAAVTFSVAAFQYVQFCVHGGSYVAEEVGAHKVNLHTVNPQERKLLNIVEEVALAAALPIPPVYILETPQINAFAAGTSQKDAAITVTRGCLDILNRDELQGVIAHEFGHIYNADMKISLRLAAMVMGFFFILYISMRMLQFANVNRSRDQKGNPVVLAGLVLLIAGAFTWLFGMILKAAVSREREYLADACAVQFTRNPEGIANALRKIGRETERNEMPKSGMAYTHMYIDDRGGFSALFATHPPLKRRIAAIEDREYIPEDWEQPSK